MNLVPVYHISCPELHGRANISRDKNNERGNEWVDVERHWAWNLPRHWLGEGCYWAWNGPVGLGLRVRRCQGSNPPGPVRRISLREDFTLLS